MMGIGRHLGWGGGSSLSEVTSIQLEFRDISRYNSQFIFFQGTITIFDFGHLG